MAPAHILVVDDEPFNVDLLCQELDELDYTFDTAENGQEALEKLAHGPFDAVLLDMMMPVMSGMDVLEAMNASGMIFEVPVIIVSALDDMRQVTKSLELGAEDYLHKPIDETLLKARLTGALEKKSLRDQLAQQLKITTELFGKFVPEQVARSMVSGAGEMAPVECEATIMFCDMVGFTPLVETIPPREVLDLLTAYFQTVLPVVEANLGVVNEFHGDGMFVVFNAPMTLPDHAQAAVKAGLDILETLEQHDVLGHRLRARVGIATGNVVAGTIQTLNQLNYSVMGDTVNLAARLEKKNKELSSALLISERTAQLLPDLARFEAVSFDVKGKSDRINAYKLLTLGK